MNLHSKVNTYLETKYFKLDITNIKELFYFIIIIRESYIS